MDKNRKILVFTPFYHPRVGGLESHATQFNNILAERGNSILVFTSQVPSSAARNEIVAGDVNGRLKIEIIRFPTILFFGNFPIPKIWAKAFWQEWRNLKNYHPDIVISRTRFFSTSLMALFYAKTYRYPWLHIEHGSDYVKLNSRIYTLLAFLYDITLGRVVLFAADRVVANSQASMEFVKKLVPRRVCDVIYRGVEIKKIDAIEKDHEILTKYEGKVIVTFVGRIIDGKGVSDLIRAISGINNDSLRCLLVGDGPAKNDLIKLSKALNISDRIIFLGERKFSEAIAIVKASDIFVNPSYTEGLPTSVIEAAICGKAVIATDVGGTTEILSNAACCFIKPHDINQLRVDLIRLIASKTTREEIGNRAALEVIGKFSWNVAIEKYQKIFCQMDVR